MAADKPVLASGLQRTASKLANSPTTDETEKVSITKITENSRLKLSVIPPEVQTHQKESACEYPDRYLSRPQVNAETQDNLKSSRFGELELEA